MTNEMIKFNYMLFNYVYSDLAPQGAFSKTSNPPGALGVNLLFLGDGAQSVNSMMGVTPWAKSETGPAMALVTRISQVLAVIVKVYEAHTIH